MPALDQNIVTTIWGTAALFGILVSLMVPQAEQYYKDFLVQGTDLAHRQAKRWIRYTRLLPFAIAILLIPLALFAILPDSHVAVAWPPGRDLLLVSSGIIVLVVFGLAVIAITRTVPEFDLDLISNRPESECKSRKTTTATKITFLNEGKDLLIAYWLDWNGVRSTTDHRYELIPGEPYEVQTYVDHYFVVVAANDEDHPLAIVAGRITPSRVRLSGG